MAKRLSPELIHKTATQAASAKASDLSKPPGLRRRGGSWEIRVRVPKKLRPAINRGEIISTLGGIGTTDAYRAGWLALAKIHLKFEKAEITLGLRSKPLAAAVPAANLSEEQLTAAANAYLRKLEGSAAPIPLDEEAQRDVREAIDEEAGNVGRPNAVEDATLQRVANSFASEIGLKVPDAARMGFYEALRSAWLEHLQRQAARFAGVQVTSINPAFANVQAVIDAATPMTLSEAIASYKSRPSRAALAGATHKAVAFRLRALEELIGGERQIGSIGRADLRAYVADLQNVPAHAAQRFRGMMMREAMREAERSGAPLMAAKSIKLYVETAASLFKWLSEEHMIERNPAVRLDTPPVPEKSDRRPFTTDELKKLLHATSAHVRGGKDWTYWTVRIALLNGLRLTEPLGLEVRDLVEEDGYWCLRVQANEQRSVKTEGTARTIPLHPLLLRLGLLAVARGKKPRDLLLNDVPRGKGTSFNAAQKRLGRLIDQAVSSDPEITMHSLRHNYRDAQRAADVPLDVAAALGGWTIPGLAGNSAMEGYGRGHRISMLAEWGAKITYPGVDLALIDAISAKTN